MKDLISNILVPDPDLRYSLKQVKQHRWFGIYSPSTPISSGIRVGIDKVVVYDKLLTEMKENFQLNEKYIEQCLQANRHNQVTAHYFLLLKDKIQKGEEFA